MKPMQSLILLAALFFLSQYAMADACEKPKQRGEICRVARKDDPHAKSYSINRFKELIREAHGTRCVLRPQDHKGYFKVDRIVVAGHTKDVTDYYIQSGPDVYSLTVHKNDKSCADAKPKQIASNVRELKVVNSSSSTVTNLIIKNSGTIQAWGPADVEAAFTGMVDVNLNNCFNREAKILSEYEFFMIDKQRIVYGYRKGKKEAIKNEIGEILYFESLADFQFKRKLCQEKCD